MSFCDLDPNISAFLGLDPDTQDTESGYSRICGTRHDHLARLKGSVYETGKTAVLGLDRVRNDPNGRVVIDFVNETLVTSMHENGIGCTLVGGYRLYEGDEVVPSANTFNFPMDKESLRVQRIIYSLADTLVLALAINLCDEYYLQRITNMGLLITDDYNKKHILLASVFNGVNRTYSTTLHGAIFELDGDAGDRFFHHKGYYGKIFKSILRSVYPYSELLPIAEQKGLI